MQQDFNTVNLPEIEKLYYILLFQTKQLRAQNAQLANYKLKT